MGNNTRTMTTNLSVTAPLGKAFSRVNEVLFKPFDIAKWFVLGFCAWLAYLGQGGGGGGGGFNFHSGRHGGSGGLREAMVEARDYIFSNLVWLVPVVAGALLVALVIWLVILWVSSRGRFMYLHCVALNRAEIKQPWNDYAPLADSLFWFRVVVSALGLVVLIPLTMLAVVLLWPIMVDRGVVLPALMLFLGVLLLMFVTWVFLWLVSRLLTDFVIPVQYLRRVSCMEAWRQVLGLVRGAPGQFALYLLFRIVLALAIGAVLVALIFATCCIAGCIMAIPYIGTVLILPVLVFERSYSLYYLAQLGPEYDVFSPNV